VEIPHFSEEDSNIKGSKSSYRPHLITKQEGTTWLTVVDYCVKR